MLGGDILNDFSQLNLGREKMNQINLYNTFNVNLILNRTTVYIYQSEADLIISMSMLLSSTANSFGNMRGGTDCEPQTSPEFPANEMLGTTTSADATLVLISLYNSRTE